MTSVDPVDATAASPAGVVCAACDHLNPPRARFCNACGLPVHHAQCPVCEAINDGVADRCYKCQTPLRPGSEGLAATEARPGTAEPDQQATGQVAAPESVHDDAPTWRRGEEVATPVSLVDPPRETSPSTFERAVAESAPDVAPSVVALDRADAPIHYVGMLTARADEAELDRADVVADRHARRARKVRYAAAALLMLPSVIAGTFYALEHQEKVEALVEYTRVAVVAPIVRAASSVIDPHRTSESSPDNGLSAPQQAPPAPTGGQNDLPPSGPPAQTQDQALHEPSHAAEASSDAGAANTAR